MPGEENVCLHDDFADEEDSCLLHVVGEHLLTWPVDTITRPLVDGLIHTLGISSQKMYTLYRQRDKWICYSNISCGEVY